MKKLSIALTVLFTILAADFSADAQKSTRISKERIIAEQPTEQNAPTRFGEIRAYSEGRGVWLEWTMTAEANNLGFSVRRASGANSLRQEAANRGLIPGAYLELGETSSTGRKYGFFDAAGDLNSTYTIETLNTNSEKTVSSRVRPATVADISVFAGASLDALKASVASARPEITRNEFDAGSFNARQAMNAPQADPVKQLWVAAQPGAKIGVRRDGLYRVTRTELEGAGFDVNAPTNLWQLYVNGIQQAITVGAGGSYIEFYGRAVDTTEANTQIYYLVVGDINGKRIAENFRNVIVEGRVPIGTFQTAITKKERLNYSSNILNGDEENFFGSIITGSGGTVNLTLTGVDFSASTVSLDVSLVGLTTTQHQTRVSINGHELGAIDNSQRDSATAHYEFPTAYLVEGNNALQMTSLLGSGDISFFDRAKVNFKRKFKAEGNSLTFFINSPRQTYAENFASANIRVFDISSPDSPVRLTGFPTEQSGGSYRVYIQTNRSTGRGGGETLNGKTLFAVEDSAILQAATVTANQPSQLSTAAHNADLILITYKTWAAQANDWANYRRAQGATVEVVNIEDVFDEYNYGVYGSLAIRSFLQYAAANWQTAPKYVLLVGDATYDPKNYFGAGYNSFIPTKLVDTIYTETPSDDTLADFNDDGLAELPIGRIPAKSGAYVTQQLNKVTSFEQSVANNNGLAQRGALFVSDAPVGYDFQALSDRVRQQLPQTVPTVSLNKLDQNANANLTSEMSAGKFIVNYSGHGSAADWAGDSSFFGKGRVGELTNTNLSVFTMLTCLNGYFINPNQSTNGDGLAEALLTSQNGAVASWASTGLTTPDVQEIMATRFYQQLGAGSMTRLGDLIKDAKTEINFGRDVRLSWVLLGDPMLKVK
jgi:hypothetical protein